MPKKLPEHKVIAARPEGYTPQKDCRVILRFWEPTGKGHVAPNDSSCVHHGYTKKDAYRLFKELEEIMHPTPSYRTQLIIEQLQHPDKEDCPPGGPCNAGWVQLEAWEWDPKAQAWYRYTKGQWQ